MKNNSTINNKIPQLRFPGFTGDWEEKSLGEVGVFVRGLSYNKGEVTQDRAATLVLRSNNIIQDGVVDCRNGLQFVTKEPSSEQILQKGDIVICLSNGSSNLVGKSANYEGDYAGIATVGAFCGIYRSTAPITKYLVQTPAYKKSVELIKQGGNGALANLYGRDILGLKFYFPTLEEQNEIVECLEAEDRMIAAQEQKVESLKAHKKGLMQQLFPQPGATTPALRFPGFEEFWEEKKLGDICDSILVGFPFKGQDITDNSSGHPILRAYSIGEGIIRHGKDYDKYYPGDTKPLEMYKVSTGDIVISMDGSVGRNIALVSDDENGYLLIQRVARLRVTKYPVQLIYQQIISQRFKDYVAGEKVGAVIAHISQKQIESFPVFIPKSQQEQNKVADALTETDRLISTQEQKVESLKTHKKGLMQQLFPQLQK